ncbi:MULTISPECIES: hypothetical protein [Asticcacaulis]|uniref:hypothetical protein n=1 Tax=Asticcacaulis TaxID=76890 RepID=UPI001AE4D00F|nr:MULTISPECIES: hypothetical protein [Asticcacaulis]MBP2157472.1 hypothetical protein [Asticcacaulis solisilvae]MDR6798517.1 hypothetical protein [Asticcacaulis sp. BE141]
MMEAWFPPDGAYYFASASLLCLTALAAPTIAKGRRRTLIVGIWGAVIALGLGLLGLGGLALIGHQPGYVVTPLLATGLVMSVGYGVSLLFVLRAYRMAERRRVAAREL